MENLLFTTPDCSNCSAAKDFLDLSGVDFGIIDASTKEGMELVKKYGVGKVPALIVVDDDGEIQDSARGFEEIETMISHR